MFNLSVKLLIAVILQWMLHACSQGKDEKLRMPDSAPPQKKNSANIQNCTPVAELDGEVPAFGAVPLGTIDGGLLRVGKPTAYKIRQGDQDLISIIINNIDSTTNSNYVADYAKFRICKLESSECLKNDLGQEWFETGAFVDTVPIPPGFNGTLKIQSKSCAINSRTKPGSQSCGSVASTVFYQETNKNSQLSNTLSAIHSNRMERAKHGDLLAVKARAYLQSLNGAQQNGGTQNNALTQKQQVAKEVALTITANPKEMGAVFATDVMDSLLAEADQILAEEGVSAQLAEGTEASAACLPNDISPGDDPDDGTLDSGNNDQVPGYSDTQSGGQQQTPLPPPPPPPSEGTKDPTTGGDFDWEDGDLVQDGTADTNGDGLPGDVAYDPNAPLPGVEEEENGSWAVSRTVGATVMVVTSLWGLKQLKDYAQGVKRRNNIKDFLLVEGENGRLSNLDGNITRGQIREVRYKNGEITYRVVDAEGKLSDSKTLTKNQIDAFDSDAKGQAAKKKLKEYDSVGKTRKTGKALGTAAVFAIGLAMFTGNVPLELAGTPYTDFLAQLRESDLALKSLKEQYEQLVQTRNQIIINQEDSEAVQSDYGEGGSATDSDGDGGSDNSSADDTPFYSQ